LLPITWTPARRARRAREAGEGNRELDVAALVAREFGDARGW